MVPPPSLCPTLSACFSRVSQVEGEGDPPTPCPRPSLSPEDDGDWTVRGGAGSVPPGDRWERIDPCPPSPSRWGRTPRPGGGSSQHRRSEERVLCSIRSRREDGRDGFQTRASGTCLDGERPRGRRSGEKHASYNEKDGFVDEERGRRSRGNRNAPFRCPQRRADAVLDDR